MFYILLFTTRKRCEHVFMLLFTSFCLGTGDHVYKRNEELPLREQMITALPDVKSLTLQEDDEFMVLACDGIW